MENFSYATSPELYGVISEFADYSHVRGVRTLSRNLLEAYHPIIQEPSPSGLVQVDVLPLQPSWKQARLMFPREVIAGQKIVMFKDISAAALKAIKNFGAQTNQTNPWCIRSIVLYGLATEMAKENYVPEFR